MYKKASRLKLRISTSKGRLSVEQLWDLSLSDLSTTIKEVAASLKEASPGDELSFLEATTTPDPIDELTFNILKDIYTTKKSEAEEAKSFREVKAYNQKILGLIAEKEEEGLKNMSKEDLEKLLK